MCNCSIYQIFGKTPLIENIKAYSDVSKLAYVETCEDLHIFAHVITIFNNSVHCQSLLCSFCIIFGNFYIKHICLCHSKCMHNCICMLHICQTVQWIFWQIPHIVAHILSKLSTVNQFPLWFECSQLVNEPGDVFVCFKWCVVADDIMRRVCSWLRSMRSCLSIPECKLAAALVLQYCIRYNGTGTSCKITLTNSTKYGPTFVQLENVKSFWMLFTEIGVLSVQR